MTPEQLKAREEAARKAAPPRKLVMTVDGKPIIQEVVEGVSAFDYDRGEYIARVPVKAGERFLRASFPELADLDDPRKNINPDMRRGLFVDYLEIVGPFNPSAEPRKATSASSSADIPRENTPPNARARSSRIWCAAPTAAPRPRKKSTPSSAS